MATFAQQTDLVRDHQEKLLEQIDPYLPIGGEARGLRPALRAAFLACPRHRFLRRFKTERGGPVHELTEDNLSSFLPVIYSESLQIYVDETGQELPASNSEPGLVMYLLELLDLESGHSVLEIGSGGGWLTAVIAHVVGPHGRVVGIEINPHLARESRRTLAGMLNGQSTTIVAGDGAAGYVEGAPYDRVTVTAGCDSFPGVLFDQVSEQGLVLLPISNKGGGEEVFLLRRQGDHFRSETAVNAWYVPLTGRSKISGYDGRTLEHMALWRRLQDRPCHSQKFWLGGRGARDLASRSYRFRSFLGKVEPGFEVFGGEEDDLAAAAAFRFGIVDEKENSIALLDGDELRGYGSPAAVRRFLGAYELWCALFMPSGIAFDLSVYRRGGVRPEGSHQWLEQRGECDFLWSLPNEPEG